MSVVWEKCVVGADTWPRGPLPTGGAGGTTKGGPLRSKFTGWSGARGGRAQGCPPRSPVTLGSPDVLLWSPGEDSLQPGPALVLIHQPWAQGVPTLQCLPRRTEVPPDVCLTWGLHSRDPTPGPEPSPWAEALTPGSWPPPGASHVLWDRCYCGDISVHLPTKRAWRWARCPGRTRPAGLADARCPQPGGQLHPHESPETRPCMWPGRGVPHPTFWLLRPRGRWTRMSSLP